MMRAARVSPALMGRSQILFEDVLGYHSLNMIGSLIVVTSAKFSYFFLGLLEHGYKY